MICPACKGRGATVALVDGASYRGPLEVACSRCRGSGKTNPERERWAKIGGTHRTWRIAQHESLRECALRLGVSLTALSAMESGRSDPTMLMAALPAELLGECR